MNAIILALAGTLFLLPGPAKDKPPTVYSLPLPPKPDFSAVDWLVGEWNGKSAAPSPAGEAHLSVTYDLDKRVVVLRETLNFTAAANVPASQEQWVGILTPEAGGRGFMLRVFSSTGFVTRYRAAADKGVIHLVPAGGDSPPSGWLFRRTLSRSGETTLTETVEAAPPDKPFFDYYTIQFTRATASPPALPPMKSPAASPTPAPKP